MRYLLDSNFCIEILRGKSHVAKAKLQTIEVRLLALCSVVEAELLVGVALSQNPASALSKLAPFLALPSFSFDRLAAQNYAAIRSELQLQGKLIGPNDLMIAAIARANNLTLITHNTGEFCRVRGLTIEDWQI